SGARWRAQPHVDPAMSLQGWISMGDDRAATVAERASLRRARTIVQHRGPTRRHACPNWRRWAAGPK
ncbi:hypothetical protein C7E25_22590, partial [Stenotrophomonas maltophilia]